MSAIPGPKSPAALARVLAAFRESVPAGLMLLQEKYGDVCAVGFWPFRWVFLFGPEANELVFSDLDTFRFAGGYEILRPIAGDTALVVTDGDEHARRRSAIQSSFARKKIESYTQLMLERLDPAISRWSPGQRIDVYTEIREAIRQATLEAFAGDRIARSGGYIIAQLNQVHDSMNRSMLKSLLTWNLQFLINHKAKKALASIDVEIYSEIARRRRERDYGEDLISAMLMAGEAGDAFTDREIRDMLMSLLIASYDPVSSALGWAVYSMLSSSGVWSRARSEVIDVCGQESVSVSDVRRLSYLGRVVNETLRLYPAVVASPRVAASPFEFGGFRFAAGTHVLASEYVTHHLEAVWPDAERFLPDRWDRSAASYRAPTPYEYLPFGSGPRRCLGGGLAAACVPAVLARLLQRTELRGDPGRPRLSGIAALTPRDGVWATVAPIDSPLGLTAAQR
jgi:cytochrome P450